MIARGIGWHPVPRRHSRIVAAECCGDYIHLTERADMGVSAGRKSELTSPSSCRPHSSAAARSGTLPCKERNEGATPSSGSAANAIGTTTLVAALAVEAQKAGHLTGNEEMEGAIPSDGSPCGGGSTEEHEVASLGIRVRFPAAAPVECSRDYIGKRFERSQEVRTLQGAKALEVSATLSTSIDSSVPERTVNAQGTTWTLRVAGSTPARRARPAVAQRQSSRQRLLLPCHRLSFCIAALLGGSRAS